jgi:hypothetical protein
MRCSARYRQDEMLQDDFTVVRDDYKWRVRIQPDPSGRAAFHLTSPHMVQQSAIIEAEDYVKEWMNQQEQEMPARRQQKPVVIGEKNNNLTVLSRADHLIAPDGGFIYRWNCKCDCGRTAIVRASKLRSQVSCRACLKVRRGQHTARAMYAK